MRVTWSHPLASSPGAIVAADVETKETLLAGAEAVAFLEWAPTLVGEGAIHAVL